MDSEFGEDPDEDSEEDEEDDDDDEAEDEVVESERFLFLSTTRCL